MTTPYTYGHDHFALILDQFPNLSVFHQTSVSNLQAIIHSERVYSTGTLWGKDNTEAPQNMDSGKDYDQILPDRPETIGVN